MQITHSRSTDSAPVVAYLKGELCSASDTADFLSDLGLAVETVNGYGETAAESSGLVEAPVVLIGDQILDVAGAIHDLKVRLEAIPQERLVVMISARQMSFQQRFALSVLGNVRVFSVNDDCKRIRDLIRDWMRDRTMHGYRVLLVEDSRVDAYAATGYMRSVGIEVMHIKSAETVLAAIEQFEPDLIVSDLHMPDCEGDQMARIVRQDIDATMPIIFLSSESSSEKQLVALSAGADGFIRKPLVLEPFIQALKSTIRRSVSLENRMRRDPLTNLLNRAQFNTNMRRQSERGERCALAILDIDHFKQVNDTHGHPVGDQVICGIAQVLADGLRSTDYVGRVGGEEFGILMPDCGVVEAETVLHRLRERFQSMSFSGAGSVGFSCTFSAGLVELGSDMHQSYKLADEALYTSKKNGRNRVTVRPYAEY
ncbi:MULTISPECIES: GGDEF domain-containing protein [Pseudomonas]|jgi:diguanylate cyclase (GGDEF)-like protein|uniref:GGDEF domain-containing protein n=1 Tax=Pseudomonas TaxID=286 RepID=UPI0018E8E532|nr:MULTISPECIES: diguanylate cyclase [Pseudomonas]MBJ2214127.1 diguanylate cyclase [Pseudomonas carnis]MBP5947995.1 diguanylate cyclase [Pseudomonas sp. P9(2020)]